MQQQTNKIITSTSQLIKQLSDIISGSSRVVCQTFSPFIPCNLPEQTKDCAAFSVN